MQRIIPIALVVLALACSKKEEPASEPEPTPVTTPVTTKVKTEAKVAVPEPKPAVVTLISAGNSPQAPLRYQFEKGQKQNAKVSVDVSVEMSVDEQARPNPPSPPVFFDLAFEVTEVEEDGTAQIGVSVQSAGVSKTEGFPEQIVAQIKQATEGIVGVQGSYRCDPRGFIEELVVNVPPTADPSVRQAADNVRQAIRFMHPRLPEEPVGKGGEWSVKSEFPHIGVQVTQQNVFTIKKLELPVVIANTSSTQKAGEQTMIGSGGRQAQLKSLSTESDGSVRWNLGKLVPATFGNTSKTTMDMATAASGGGDTNVSLVVNQTVSITGG